jgi:hypothetical protein
MRLVGIVSEIFLDYANDLNAGYFARNADDPVPSWDTQQFVMHGEAISESFNPAQTSGIILDANWVPLLITIDG